jgi:hypothetical protein
MRKIIMLLAVFGVLFSASLAFAAVTVRYHNSDSTTYEWKATCSGSSKSVEFGSSRTASVTIQGSGPCTVHTPNGDVELSGGEKIEIEDATITIK